MDTQGKRLKKIRLALNLSQEEFGQLFEIGKQFVSLMENDKSFMNNDKLVKLLLDFNVNINYLLCGIGPMFLPPKYEDVEDELTQKVEAILKKNGIILQKQYQARAKWLQFIIKNVQIVIIKIYMMFWINVLFATVLIYFKMELKNRKNCKRRNKGKNLIKLPDDYTIIDIETTGLSVSVH